MEAPIEILRRSFDNWWRGDLGVSDYALGTALNCLMHFFQNKLHSMHAQDGTIQGAMMLPSGGPLPAWRLYLSWKSSKAVAGQAATEQTGHRDDAASSVSL